MTQVKVFNCPVVNEAGWNFPSAVVAIRGCKVKGGTELDSPDCTSDYTIKQSVDILVLSLNYWPDAATKGQGKRSMPILTENVNYGGIHKSFDSSKKTLDEVVEAYPLSKNFEVDIVNDTINGKEVELIVVIDFRRYVDAVEVSIDEAMQAIIDSAGDSNDNTLRAAEMGYRRDNS